MFGGGIPFAFPGGSGARFVHMGGIPMGGMPGGGRPPEPPKDVDTRSLYEDLGVSPNSSTREIKVAYMKLARTAHPDRGGDAERFKKIQHAYGILGDEEKRKLYDKYGEEGVEAGGRPGGGDPFEAMFGGGGRRSGPPKSDPTVHPLAVKLEHLYSGKSVRMAVTRDIFEEDSSGSIMTRDGTRYRRRQEKKVIQVHVEKGMRDGQRITFPGDGDVLPGRVAGDVVFVIKEQGNSVFQRKGGDLVMKKKISLFEALTGVEFVITHLDGHKIKVSSKPGEVLADETVKEVKEEGMPIFGHSSYMKGALFIQFEVEMPKKLDLTEAQKRALGMLLGATVPGTAGASSSKPTADEGDGESAAAAASASTSLDGDEDMGGDFIESRTLDEPDMEARKAREALISEAEGSDDEEAGPGGQQVRCATH